MSVGFPQTLNDLNSRAGSLSVAMREQMKSVQTFQNEIAAITDATFLGAPYSMSQADINTLRSAIGDLNDLANVYLGVTSTHVTGTYNYQTFSKLLWGFV